MKKILFSLFSIVASVYLLLCGLLFLWQEKLIFPAQKLDKTAQFQFEQVFEEKYIPLSDGTILNGLLFKAENSKGLIFYLHGNAGALNSWGQLAPIYTNLNYDVFLLDYRGYGKSEGTINSPAQMYQDMQLVYDDIKKTYPEEQIIVLGYSIGTGLAAKIAATNKPKLLILQAPYYSMTDLMQQRFPMIPSLLLKYKFATYQDLKLCNMPVIIFHGDSDEVIYYGSSLKLQQQFRQQDRLITLRGQKHNGITANKEYQQEISRILNPTEYSRPSDH